MQMGLLANERQVRVGQSVQPCRRLIARSLHHRAGSLRRLSQALTSDGGQKSPSAAEMHVRRLVTHVEILSDLSEAELLRRYGGQTPQSRLHQSQIEAVPVIALRFQVGYPSVLGQCQPTGSKLGLTLSIRELRMAGRQTTELMVETTVGTLAVRTLGSGPPAVVGRACSWTIDLGTEYFPP
jgi:hypothetical protein